jgi:hypothetical protein
MELTTKFVLAGNPCTITARVKAVEAKARRTIDLTPAPDRIDELSISAEFDGAFGQCDSGIREAAEDVDGAEDVLAILDIWSDWHLNATSPGSRAQMAYLATLPDAPIAYDQRRAALSAAGLNEPYAYGSDWLLDPLPEDVKTRLAALFAAVNGKRFGEAPDLEDLPEISGDVLDSRDVIKRYEGFREAVIHMGLDPDAEDFGTIADEVDADTVREYVKLRTLNDQGESLDDWSFGVTLVSDDYFEEYAQELAGDIGAIQADAKWPNNHIDWTAAADELKGDYTAIEYNGDTYWGR